MGVCTSGREGLVTQGWLTGRRSTTALVTSPRGVTCTTGNGTTGHAMGRLQRFDDGSVEYAG